MYPFLQIQDYDSLKILADDQRRRILRLLMSGSATLSQLGHQLGEHPAQIRHHLKLLENAGLVELVGTHPVRGFVEKYYLARARAFLLQELLLPAIPGWEIVPILGSHDLALEFLAEQAKQKKGARIEYIILPLGSLDGLIALRQGLTQLAGCHLLDAQSGEYNLPFVQRFFPDQEVVLLTLAHREQGLMVPSKNPRQIHGLEDLGRADLKFVNRPPGSGTRLWLDQHMKMLRLLPQSVHGYDFQVYTHTAVAEAIVDGRADFGLGLRAAANKHNLDFIPLFQERFDLVIHRDHLQDPRLLPLLDFLNSAAYRRGIESLGGYSTSQTGAQHTF